MAYTYEDKLEFAASLYCKARMFSERLGCSWELIIAQACQECGWGEKCLPGSNNIYNIKADPSWKGPKKKYYVREEINHQNIMVWNDFRVYGSYAESLEDRMRFLEQNPRYQALMKPGIKGDYRAEAHQMLKSKYATDSEYAIALIRLIETKTFKRAMARAMKRGCGPLLPAIDIRVLDGAHVPIPNARLEVQLDGKKAEAAANAEGRLVIRHKLPCGDLHLRVYDQPHDKWVDLDPLKTETTASGQSVTLVAPDFVAQTSTREHEKKTPPKPAPAASTPAPAPVPAAGPTAYKMHPVKPGQSLSKIGILHGVSYQAIAKANGITSPFIIRPGQMLRIPVVPQTAPAAGPQAAPTAPPQHPAAPSVPGTPANHPPAAPRPAAPAGHPAATAAPDEHAAQAAPARPATPSAALGETLKEGSPALHTVYMRNEKNNPQTDLMHSSRAPWLAHAQKEFEKGVYRRAGKANDPRILEYFRATKETAWIKEDEKAYCAVFINWCLAQENYTGIRDGKAVRFKDWGRPTRDNKPALGAVALLEVAKDTYHVTFVVGIDARRGLISTLGGNQGGRHGVTHSHCGTSIVRAYRYPANYPHYDDDYVLHHVPGDNLPMTAASTR